MARLLKILSFNANGILRQRHEFSKQLEDLRIDVDLFSETHLKPHEKIFLQNYHVYRTDRYPGRKGGAAIAVRKGIPNNHVKCSYHYFTT
jgi:exonuclease III